MADSTSTTAREADALGLFFRQASRYPLLSAAEEVELAQRIERGDLEAKDRMINSNLRLVISQARRFQGQGLPMGDLVQEGMLGLIRAVEKFDWRKGFKFSTYAVLWIKQSIQRGLANSGTTIRIPVHIGQRERKVKKHERELAVTLGRQPTRRGDRCRRPTCRSTRYARRSSSRGTSRASTRPSPTTARRRWATCCRANVPSPRKR